MKGCPLVFPEARLKIFLTASAESRAKRRYNQLKEKGISSNIDDLVSDLKDRDRRDMEPILSRTTSVRLTVRELLVTEMFIRTMSDAIRENWSAKVQQTGFSSGQMKVRIKYWIWELIPTVCELPKK